MRGGGHNGGGLGVCDDGLVIDLSRHARSPRRSEANARCASKGGCTWGDVDHATHAFGLACPSGIISTTGVGGLTLGGGIGHLTRKLRPDDRQPARGRRRARRRAVRDASAKENPDLFWAIRGGGGNFGVVTSFLFRLHPVNNIVGGPMFWTLDQAAEVMRWYRDFIRQAPQELNGLFAFLTVPPVPPFPEALHLKKMCGVVWCYTGPPEQGREGVRAGPRVRTAGAVRDPRDAVARRCRASSTRSIRRAISGTGAPTS